MTRTTTTHKILRSWWETLKSDRWLQTLVILYLASALVHGLALLPANSFFDWAYFPIVLTLVVLALRSGLSRVGASAPSRSPPGRRARSPAGFSPLARLQYRLLERGKKVAEEDRDSLSDQLISRARAQAERERLITELEAKNEELERFTYTVSHDLKSPLITIGGFLGLAKKDLEKGEVRRVESDLEQIRDAAMKMGELLADLLELSRIGRAVNPPEHLPFNELAREAVTLVEGRIAATGARIDPSLCCPVGARSPTPSHGRIRSITAVETQ